MCGGTEDGHAAWMMVAGLSPRVRGNRVRRICRASRRGSIPACAGEPSIHAVHRPGMPVYPRVCGGTVYRPPVQQLRRGLSPRVRGNRPEPVRWRDARRSIPACAGEPASAAQRAKTVTVYPRVCGGTYNAATTLGRLEGLSPRVRGNRPTYGWAADQVRSIPACAGEPGQRLQSGRTRQVYPRVCGGTLRSRRLPAADAVKAQTGRRSIPACAGEPPPDAPPIP